MKIAILGGGVAGVSSAILLKQMGFDVSIYERHAASSNIGAGIVAWPNACFVLEQLGVLDAVKSVAGSPASMRRLSRSGEFLGSIDIELINKQMGYPSLSILRSDFQGILESKLASLGGFVEFGKTVISIRPRSAGQAEVQFQNGQAITADVIIGADGRMASPARRYVHGNNTPVYQGFINWVGVCELEGDYFDRIEVSDYWGVGERFGIVAVAGNKAYWAGGVACTEISPKVPAHYKDELASAFAGWPAPIQAMIEHTPLERMNKIYVHDHDPIGTWHRDNVIAIGDAAHASLPTSGQGACQALEDAWHLAACLKESSQDLPQAFAKFTEIRLDKTTGITVAGRRLAASLFNRDQEFCRVRNDISKNTDFQALAEAMATGWSHHLPLMPRQAREL
ncbi:MULTISPECIES: FAD-dependent monooxygenase [unclassified Duganella]|uniref:FAD-dependent monooxygenase n=1 Tax=unclassified Duganella TaxID=2636909 RepID=UPI0006FA14F8|nr:MULTISPECIES: FAD-dependent monooxygenase [unclassified Duganella]KQV43012.1 flavoprotein monooxygenase acting on aromatic compound [Duganella sp. Root336D2]KRB97140.1 flavoprotein monooxygenase acting on aromatic compound [Duganella sp. Root198D2]